EIIFVADYALHSVPVRCGDNGRTISRRFNSIAPGNGVANGGDRGVCSVAGEVGAKKSAIACKRVAIRATCRPKEDSLATNRIARKVVCSGSALQGSQVADDVAHLLRIEFGESWHARSGNPFCNDAAKFGI